jgi:hypothetical protein
MHLCFALSWGTSWKPFVCFSIWFKHTFDFHCFIFMIFHLCSFSCYNMVAKFLLSRLCLSCPCFKFFDLSTQCSTSLIQLWWCMSPQKLFFCYHLPTRGWAGVKLGDADTSQMYYNFWCSMLVFTPFALCFVTLCGIFMWFLELTYWQDTTVPVPCFLLFLCFRKATQEIFSELDETSSGTPIFPGRRMRTKREPERGQRLPTP